MNLPAQPPFEIHPQGAGGFTSFECGNEVVALPLLAVVRASLRGTTQQEVVIEFPRFLARIGGTGLADVFSHFLTGRVRVMRRGQHGQCTINSIQITET